MTVRGPHDPEMDLLALTAELVAVPSVSRQEGALADLVEAHCRGLRHLTTERVGDTVVARTDLGRPRRLVLAGHLDTVPSFGDDGPTVRDDTVWGLGAVDMKGGLAVLMALAAEVAEPACDATFVFYPAEEIEHRFNGLVLLAGQRPDLVVADAAVLCEPTGGRVEAGCQGTMRVTVTLAGRRAHTARPAQGRNAVHRLGPVLDAVAGFRPRSVELDGCTYVEQMQAVGVTGGTGRNVVPDHAELVVNHRFAPDRDVSAAESAVRGVVAGEIDESQGDTFVVSEVAGAAPPSLGHPLLRTLTEASGRRPRSKLGWTDVATFWEVGVPATNFGPGDPELCHTPDEHVSRSELNSAMTALASVLRSA
jgi:succinyl-diaminopimelate desuccinylase